MFAPNNPIVPINVAVKYDPPTIAIFYKRNKQSTKKHMYSILLNDLINLNDSQHITTKLYQEHSLFVNESVIEFSQLQENVEILLNYLRQQQSYEENQDQYGSAFHQNNNSQSNTFQTNSKFGTLRSSNSSAFKSPINYNKFQNNNINSNSNSKNQNQNQNNYIYEEEQQQESYYQDSPDPYMSPHGSNAFKSINNQQQQQNAYKQQKQKKMRSKNSMQQLQNNYQSNRNNTIASQDEQDDDQQQYYYDNNNNNNNNQEFYDEDNNNNNLDQGVVNYDQNYEDSNNEYDQRDISVRRDTDPSIGTAQLPPGFQIKAIQSNQSLQSKDMSMNTPLSPQKNDLDLSIEYEQHEQQYQINNNQSNIFTPFNNKNKNNNIQDNNVIHSNSSFVNMEDNNSRRKRKTRSSKFGMLKQLAENNNNVGEQYQDGNNEIQEFY